MKERLLAAALVALSALPAAANEAEPAALSPFSGDFGNALWTVLIFVLVLVVLGKFAWGPILGMLKEREDFIRKSLHDAKHDREQAEARLKEYTSQLQAARAEAASLVENARRDADRLRELEDAVEALLLRGQRGSLRSIGAGEMTCVLSWQGFACKRLPPIIDTTRLERHRELILEYVDRLEAAGIAVLDTAVQLTPRHGYAAAYVVQPQLERSTLLPVVMASMAPGPARALAGMVFERVEWAAAAGIGLDANLSNWAVCDGRPLYIDVSTPMLRDAAGRHRLDSDLFVSTMPVLLRGLVRRYFVKRSEEHTSELQSH